MKNMLVVNNFSRSRAPAKSFQKLAKKVLKEERQGAKDVSLVLVGAARMRKLNRTYANKDYAANVLSFAGQGKDLGEIVLCPFVIKKNAVEYNISFQKALLWMFVHGLLHLLGHEHKAKKGKREMTRKEQKYLS